MSAAINARVPPSAAVHQSTSAAQLVEGTEPATTTETPVSKNRAERSAIRPIADSVPAVKTLAKTDGFHRELQIQNGRDFAAPFPRLEGENDEVSAGKASCDGIMSCAGAQLTRTDVGELVWSAPMKIPAPGRTPAGSRFASRNFNRAKATQVLAPSTLEGGRESPDGLW